MAKQNTEGLLTRARVLSFLGSAVALLSCHRHSSVRVSSKNFAESIIVAEAYASVLETACLPVDRVMIGGDANALAQGIKEDRIDLYPEYTWTGIAAVLKLKPPIRRDEVLNRLRAGYRQFDATWLEPVSVASNSQALAMRVTSPIGTLSQCARAASQLHLAAQKEFFDRADGLPGLLKVYGGLNFKRVSKVEKLGQQYDILTERGADVIAVSQTDPQISYDGLKVLKDDRHFWPAYNIAPVIRLETLAEYPHIPLILSHVTRLLKQDVLEQLDAHVYTDGRDPADVAQALLHSIASPALGCLW